MALKEKKPLAVAACFTSLGVTQVTVVEFKEHETKRWHRSTNLNVYNLKEDVYEMNWTLLQRGVYDFRVLIQTDHGKYRLYELENITVLGK